MKKQINPTIKAHLVRGAFYLLLLVAVCAIPFALAQRNTKKSVTRSAAAGAKVRQHFTKSGDTSLLPYDGPATARPQHRYSVPALPGGVCTSYTFTNETGTLVPGVTDIGNHTDDGDTFITLPFPVTIYDQTFTTANAGSNGHLTFGADSASAGAAAQRPKTAGDPLLFSR